MVLTARTGEVPEKVKIRLEADAPKMRQPGAALIAHFPSVPARASRTAWARASTKNGLLTAVMQHA